MYKKMSKKEIRLEIAKEVFENAQKEWDEAVSDVMQGKGLGVFGNKYDKREFAARTALQKAEQEYRIAKENAIAISDEEVDALSDAMVGHLKKPDELSEGEEDFLDAMADSF